VHLVYPVDARRRRVTIVSLTFTPLGLDRDRSRDHMAAERAGGGTHLGDGSSLTAGTGSAKLWQPCTPAMAA
jgi:hypothetical protein